MAVPYGLYVRFLITKGREEISDLNESLRELRLPGIEFEDLQRELAFIETTLPQKFIDMMGKRPESEFFRWMKPLEIQELWALEKPFLKTQEAKSVRKILYDIHQDPQVRLALNALLVKGVPHPDIIQSVATKFSTFVKESHLALYERFFFNPRRMTRGDWNAFLRASTDVEKRIYFSALSEPVDVVKSELGLPSKSNTSETLQYLLSKAVLKAKESMEVNTPEGATEARRWIDTVMKITDKYEKYRKADQTDFANTLQLEFDYVETPFETPDSEVMREVSDRNKVAATPEDAKVTDETPPEGEVV